jgi:hypothetical protein
LYGWNVLCGIRRRSLKTSTVASLEEARQLWCLRVSVANDMSGGCSK